MNDSYLAERKKGRFVMPQVPGLGASLSVLEKITSSYYTAVVYSGPICHNKNYAKMSAVVFWLRIKQSVTSTCLLFLEKTKAW